MAIKYIVVSGDSQSRIAIIHCDRFQNKYIIKLK